ncbi:hypothetical protein JW926_19205 [Candidatus Sumerlaeota bacterium]|nr:hypothetical protein [Candidatus Sumerlaeota bacterium]
MKPNQCLSRVILVSACLFCIAFSSLAATTKVFTEASFGDFSKGENKTSSLSSEGEISPAPAYESVWKGQDELTWRIIAAGRNTLYFCTGNEGRIYVMEKDKVELYCDLEEVAVFAAALDKNGVLYAGASPGGKIYRIPEKNTAQLFFETRQKYIWDIAFDKNDNLFAATGIEGKLFRIDPDGKGDTYYQATDKNLMDILIPENIPDQSIYIATHDKGRIYRVAEKDKAFVLFDSGMDEIRALVEGEPGYFYAALNSLKAPSPATPPSPKSEETKKPEESEESEGDGEESPEIETRLELPIITGKRSTIVKLDISGYAWPVISPPESPIHSLIYDSESGKLQAGIGEKGKLYQIEKPNKFTIVFATEEKYILSITRNEDFLYLGTSQIPNIYKVTWKDRSKGEYVSPVHDAKTAVKWGRIRFEGDAPDGAEIKFTTRSGNTEEPDKTWSDWEKQKSFDDKQAQIASPIARFFQYKLLLSGKDTKAVPMIKKVESYYIPPNQAPLIDKIEIAPMGKSHPPKMPPKEKSDDKSDEENSKTDNSSSIDATAHSNQKKLKISWKARDPENDKLQFDLFFKGDEENLWKEIEKKIDKPLFLLSTEPLPDGRYRIKLVASDLPSNPKNTALETEGLSDPFVIDNTPPELVKELTFDRDKNSITIHTEARDAHSIISAAQYSINADEWFRVNPEDEIFDSRNESFSFVIKDMKEEEALITFMATDAEGNTLIEKLLIKPKEKK